MKPILPASKPSSNSWISVGSTHIKRNDLLSSHYLSASESVAAVESFDKENCNKLFSNTRKQVIRNRCNVKSVDGIDDQQQRVKKLTSDNSEGYFSDLENYPLIVGHSTATIAAGNLFEESETQLNGKARLINVKKKNGTTLIFQKKSNTQKYLRANEYQELESFKKRRSLQWSSSSGSANNIIPDINRHSWNDTSRTIQEEFDSPSTQFPNRNLAEIKNINFRDDVSTTTTTSNEKENVPEIFAMRTSNENVPATRRWRFEQFLKNLVGKKPSNQVPVMIERMKQSPSEEHDLLQSDKNDRLGASIASLNSYNNNNNSKLNKSTASLNQKLWSVVPLLNRKDGHNNSCSNLLSSKNFPSSSGRMRKCETVLALTGNDEPLRSSATSYRPCDAVDCPKIHSKSINSLLEPIKPLNRLRNSQSCYYVSNNHESASSSSAGTAAGRQQCSRCSSLLSLAAIGSNYSLNVTNGAFVLKNSNSKKKLQTPQSPALNDDLLNDSDNLIGNDFNEIEPYENEPLSTPTSSATTTTALTNLKFTCKLCLGEYSTDEKLTKINSCGCLFCTECMKAYVEFEISEGAYELSCPDALCSSQGIVSLTEISQLASPSLVAKHHRYRLNREVELDKYRLWCPNRNCETICSVGPVINEKSSSTSTASQSAIQQQPSSSSTATLLIPRSVLCPTCSLEFCSSCKKAWHPSITCEENSRRMGGRNESMMLFDNDLIKCCPMCAVPIEKDEGCAQMMCKRCKHVFCWYCLASLDDDFLLRHYDKGPCKNKLGHSRASVVWHRAQVIGIFAGFGILLLVASPLLLLAAPCIVCCKCKIEESTSTKLDDDDRDRIDHQV